MSGIIEIKIEPQDISNSTEEKESVSGNVLDNFVNIKPEISEVQIKLEPMDPDDTFKDIDYKPESDLMNLAQCYGAVSDQILTHSRARHVNYKEDSDDDYDPKNVKKKKCLKSVPNVKPLFKGRPKKDEHTFSEEILSKIEIVTIDEGARQTEHQDVLNARKHMNYTCDSCAIGFVVKEAYEMHLKIHSPENGDHECSVCKIRLKTEDLLYRHRLRHYRRYRCCICELMLRDKEAVASHILSEHMGSGFLCRYCGRSFKRPKYLRRHVEQMHTKPVRLECPVCRRVFFERGWYRGHVRTHNEQVKENVNRKATCSHCGREFKNKRYLIKHLPVHESPSPATCGLCSRTFRNIEVLKVHCRQHHSKNPLRDYATNDGSVVSRVPRLSAETTCGVCGRVLTTRAMLARHMMRMHTERVRKYQCDYCQKGFFSKAEVRSHIAWTHMRVRRHACACGRVFRTPARLRAHARAAHQRLEQPKDKSCPVCGKMFASQQVLARHVKAHSGEKFPCNECGKEFKTQSYVKVHYKLKHLNMTRAQIKAQSRRKLLMVDGDELMNVRVKTKKSKVPLDPLRVDSFVDLGIVKKEVSDIQVPLFETFVDIQREC